MVDYLIENLKTIKMSLSVGIVGLANVGKSTLFEALTKKQVNISNYPFCTIDPNIGIVEVFDKRLDDLAACFHSAKKIPTVINFTDIAGLVRGASKGEGLGNQFLANIREVDAILFVVRCFESAEVVHIEKTVDPCRDIDVVNMELIFKDLETLDKRIQKTEPDVKTGKKAVVSASASGGEPRPMSGREELDILKKIKAALEEGKLARQVEDYEKLKDLQLLTAKPGIFILNSDKKEISPELKRKIEDLNSEYVLSNLRDEYDGSKFSSEEKEELGLAESKLNEIISKSYKVLGLITFFTMTSDETRAWTIEEGTRAPQAAGGIHTDFENKFICVDVINWQKLVEISKADPGPASAEASAGKQDAWSQAARQGLLRTEGKEYVVQDGDVMKVKHGG